MRYYLHLAYNGTKYSGWQRQANVNTIQETVENTITTILNHSKKVVCIGCGRTDAGVHAQQYILHFDIPYNLPEDFISKCNQQLPEDIIFYEFKKIQGNPHAQFDAKSRTYQYYFQIEKHHNNNPFAALIWDHNLDIELMKSCTQSILKNKDFYHFCKTPAKHNHTLCDIKECHLVFDERLQMYTFTITANRFLRGMIRIMVARIIEVGKGHLSFEDFNAFLSLSSSPMYLKYAPSQGLFLTQISYDFIDFIPRLFSLKRV